MAFITKEDLSSLIDAENIEVITRGKDEDVEAAITAAIQEAEPYLIRYDTEAIFATTGNARAPYTHLMSIIKDIALWNLIKKRNVSIDLELANENYKNAITSLRNIKGMIIKGWPLALVPSKGTLRYGSNTKFFTERL